MDLFEVMRTTPATRAFTDDDLPDAVLYEILDAARFAPNGGNRQAWRVVVVRDPATKRRVAELYELGAREYGAQARAGMVPFAASEASLRDERAADAGSPEPASPAAADSYLARVPVQLFVLLDLANCSAVDTGLGRLPIAAGASVYPFAHNILLAARARGFGGHITSLLARQEPALRDLLHIPAQFALATMLPLGRPARTVTKLRRARVDDFATVEAFDGSPFTAGG